MPALSDTAIKTAKVTETTYYMYDDDPKGLFLEVKTTGRKIFKVKCNKAPNRGKQTVLGEYPDIKITEARGRARAWLEALFATPAVREEARKLTAKETRTIDDAVYDYLLTLYRDFDIDLDDKPTNWKPSTVYYKKQLLERFAKEVRYNPHERLLLADLTYARIDDWKENYNQRQRAAKKTDAWLDMLDHDNVSVADNRDYYTGKRASWSGSTVFNLMLAYVKVVIKRELAHGNLTQNPLGNVRPFNVKRERKSLSLNEALAFIAAVQRIQRGEADFVDINLNLYSTASFSALLVILYTGQRPAEILSLEWEDNGRNNYVDFERNEICLREFKTSAKSSEEVTRVAMPENAKMEIGALWNAGDIFVFSSRRGNVSITPKTLSSALELAKDEMPMTEPRRSEFTAYTLRHTYATLALSNNHLTETQLMKQLKHKSINTTMIYFHQTQAQRDITAIKSADIFKIEGAEDIE